MQVSATCNNFTHIWLKCDETLHVYRDQEHINIFTIISSDYIFESICYL